VEWPTVALVAAMYAVFALLTWYHDALPWWLLLVGGAYLVCLQGSLQHEVLHGHPTPWRALNEALVFPSLSLWMPYRLYRESHLRHHRDENLTDPLNDPESFYVTAQAWDRLGGFGRAVLWFHNTVAGRLLFGPLWCVGRFAWQEVARPVRGDFSRLGAWALHLFGVALVLTWVIWICGMPILEYVALMAYPGLSLTLLRSFLEHQARPQATERTAIVEAGPVASLLFLNNNLHALHHAEPGLPWYRLPARYRARRGELLAANGNYLLRGYGEVIARHLIWPKEPPVHPYAAAADPAPASAAGLPLRQGAV